jgi:glycosyltransferase 2 family protein
MLDRTQHSRTKARRSAPAGRQKKKSAGNGKRPWSKPLGIALGIAVTLLAAYLLYRTLSKYRFDEIVAAIGEIPTTRIAMAGVFAAASYLCLTGFDWLALRYVERPLRYRYVALASFVSLSLGHNIGFAALSSGAIRYRFYSRRGLSVGEVAKVILFCGMTVGLGLAVLGGAALLLRSDLAAQMSGLGRPVVLTIGIACLAAAGGYLLLAAFLKHPLRIRNWTLEMPPLRLAAAQLVIGPLNFACVAACLHQTLLAVADLSYLAVAAAYVIAVASALITHVPGGLGVIETVVLYLLPEGRFIGALVMFRAIYFLVPLCLGAVAFALAELAFTREGRRSKRGK